MRALSAGPVSGQAGRYDRHVPEVDTKPLDERMQEIGAQLAWVRDYL
jgi:hypothetical protein